MLIDPDARVDGGPGTFRTKGRNTPFAGACSQGRVLGTWVAGGACSTPADVGRRRARPHELTITTGGTR